MRAVCASKIKGHALRAGIDFTLIRSPFLTVFLSQSAAHTRTQVKLLVCSWRQKETDMITHRRICVFVVLRDREEEKKQMLIMPSLR